MCKVIKQILPNSYEKPSTPKITEMTQANWVLLAHCTEAECVDRLLKQCLLRSEAVVFTVGIRSGTTIWTDYFLKAKVASSKARWWVKNKVLRKSRQAMVITIIDGRRVLVLILQTLRLWPFSVQTKRSATAASTSLSGMPGDVITEITVGSWMNLASLFHLPGDELLKHMMILFVHSTVKTPESLHLATTMDMKTVRCLGFVESYVTETRLKIMS